MAAVEGHPPTVATPSAFAVVFHEGRRCFDYLLVEPLPAAEPRLGRRTALSLPLFPPPT